MKGFSLCGVVLDIWVEYGQHEFTCLKSQLTHCKYFWWNFPKLVTKYVRSPCRRRVERRQLALVCSGLRRPLPLRFSMYAPFHRKLHLVWHCRKLVFCYLYGLPTPSNTKASKPLITNDSIHQFTCSNSKLPHIRILLLYVGKQRNSTLQMFCTSYANAKLSP